MKTEKLEDPARRALLSGGSLTLAAAAAATVASPASPATGEDAEGADPRQPAYRETDHVRAYYARARG